MPKQFEYIRLLFDFGDLEELNKLGSVGWHVVGLQDEANGVMALLEREVPRILVNARRLRDGVTEPKREANK